MSNARELAELGGSYGTGGFVGMKNRIINGAMVIDQRNAGASVNNPAASLTYTLDRWAIYGTAATKFSAQQNAGGLTGANLPTGFTNYLGITSSATTTPGATDFYVAAHFVEGFNAADFGWGTAAAQSVTLSFWVRSSLTGTFNVNLSNSGFGRGYAATYTVSAANTWEQKTVTIAGDTSGTWLTNNGVGVRLYFNLGSGSSTNQTVGSWGSWVGTGATGATSVVGTNGATWYITGVQLEKGSTATSFDYRPYSTELQLAQRYYYKISATSTTSAFSLAFAESTTIAGGNIFFPVSLRTSPSAIEQSGTAGDYTIRYVGSDAVCSSVPSFVSSTVNTSWFRFTVAAVLTNGQAVMLRASNTSAYLAWSAEL
jgi:hypothetical protein